MPRTDHIRMLTLDEAADLLAVSTRTMRRWIKDKTLVAHRFGRQWRISQEDLQDCLKRHRRD